MSPTELFIKRPVMTTLVSAGMLLFGVMGYLFLPNSNLPAIDYPTIQVSASLPGASPETMSTSVATPLEKQFSAIDGLASMSSTNITGQTSITLQFNLTRDIDSAAQDVQSAISAAKLPAAMPNPPNYRKSNPTQSPVFFISMYSDTMPLYRVNDYAQTLVARRISTIKDVAQVNVYGEQKYAVRVQLDPTAMTSVGVGIGEVVSAVQEANTNLPSGTLDGEKGGLTIQAPGQLTRALQYRDIIVSYRNGSPVRLKDVGDAVDGVESNKSGTWWKDRQVLMLAIQTQPGANTIEVVDAIKKALPHIRGEVPEAITLEAVYDRSLTIRESLNDVQFTLLLAIILVVGVVFAFLRNIRATIITSLAVPMSLITSFAVMYLLDYSLDALSLMALTLAVGFVVDDAIVMLENIVRHVEMGKRPMEAAIDGAREIGFTIISMTLSLCVVFLPVVLMTGMVGRILQEFAVTITVAILVSGFVSLSLTPMLASRFLGHYGHHEEGKVPKKKKILVSIYNRILVFALQHKFLTIIIFIGTLWGTFQLFGMVPKGFIPPEDRGIFMCRTRADQGISFSAMKEKMAALADIIGSDPDVTFAMPVIGRDASNSAMLVVRLKPLDQRKRSADDIIAELRPKVSGIPGLAVFMMNPPPIDVGTKRTEAAYQYTLQGTDTRKLYAVAENLTEEMRKLPEIMDVTNDLLLDNPEMEVVVDRDRARALGVSPEDVQAILYSGFSSRQISTIDAASDAYKVIVELLPEYQKSPDVLSLLHVKSSSGTLVPLSEISGIRRTFGPLQVNHSGQLPSVTVSFNTRPGVALSSATESVERLAAKVVPPDVPARFEGTVEAFKSSITSLLFLLLAAIAVIYLILGILYESFIHPLTILAGLPSAAMGALAALLVFKAELNLYGFVGVIMLIGIVKKNAIMMIDFALSAERSQGMSAQDAIHQGALTRFRPIMMTTIAAFMGILPVALGYGAGGEARRPLGLAVCGGLVVSQMVTLVITPVIYVFFDSLKTRLFPRKSASPDLTDASVRKAVNLTANTQGEEP